MAAGGGAGAGRGRAAPPSLDGRLAALLLALACCFVFVRLGARDLWAPDEPRYTQIAEELRSLEHGVEGLVLPRLNGAVYTQKPPLYYWLAAAAGAPRGHVSEGAARVPSALAALGTLAAVIFAGARLVGGRAALLAGALLLTAWSFAESSRRVQLDVLLTFFETLALFAFWRLDRGLGRRTANLVLLHAGMGLAVLTKGPVGLLVPLLAAALYLAWERRLGALGRALRPAYLLLSLGPGLAWLAAATAMAPEGYLSEAVGTNVFGRFFAGTSHARPVYYFLYQFPVEFLPWSLLWPLVLVVGRREVFGASAAPEARRSWRFLLAWGLASLLFFSLSSGKRGLYMLPAFPAAALLCASSVDRFLAGRTRLPGGLHAGAAVLGAALAALGAWIALVGRVADFPVPRLSGVALVSVLATGAALWLGFARARVPPLAHALLAVGVVFSIELGVFALVMPGLDPDKSPAPIARAAAELTPPGEAVGLVADRALVGGLVYYGRRPVAELDSPEAIRRFVEAGGRAIVVKERKLGRVEAVTRVDVRYRARSGRRAVVVVSPRRYEGR